MTTRRGSNGNNRFGATSDSEDFEGLGGYDLVSYAGAPGAVTIDLNSSGKNKGFARGDTFSSIESFNLSRHGDTFFGSSAKNAVNGDRGDDRIEGRGGNDSLSGHSGGDTILGGNGNDSIWGGGDGDYLFGGTGNDRLWGDGHDDVIDGGSDAGTLRFVNLGAGILPGVSTLAAGDRLLGGAGADTFVFNIGDGVDWIGDFTPGLDRLDIEDYWHDGLQSNGEAIIIDLGSGLIVAFSDHSSDGARNNNGIFLAGIGPAYVDHIIFI